MVKVFENRNLILFWCKLPEAGDQSIPLDRPLGGDKRRVQSWFDMGR